MIVYRVLISLFACIAALTTLRRIGWRAVPARFGFGMPVSDRPTVWLHAASNGELASVRPFVSQLLADHPDARVLVTTTTHTGVDLARSWRIPGLWAHLAPVDLAWVTRRILRRQRIMALVLVEAELWPHRVLLCPGPVVLLGARMSAGTARGWQLFPKLTRRVLGRVTYASAQDAASRDRLLGLGVPPASMGPVANLKTLYAPDTTQPPPAGFDPATTWLAASTHAGEEQTVLQAHLTARQHIPGLRLILAPRHAARGDEVAALVTAAGLSMAQRSLGQDPASAEVYLADTMGEMPMWYQAAGAVFMGGSLTDRGGHTPYEPAWFAKPILHGPDVRNHAAAYDHLTKAQAAQRTETADALAAALPRALSDRAAMGQAAKQALQGDIAAENVIAKALDAVFSAQFPRT